MHTGTALYTPRELQTSKPTSHTAESYFKDADETPPQDSSTYRVDSASEAAQRPYEPPSGQWSEAGMKTEEYRNVSEDEPYDVLNPPEERLRYGGMKRYGEDKAPETSGRGEGAQGTERLGRKPEGRA
ncbi:hypothetical protein PAXRUDRAFT_133039 [Paxillus rubicundulus Ve08.2h10]|uniref:Uncharacterized protein n=1 Tax=Paxillus rubicundulus Ve08.2h10 TaxID=930991 RepID=A0A0D0DVP3_9AGAM|nr:hypothetical protein PAXRUDRAFT_133039 [Paxillus rubicundulus Ve08.2h10]